MLLRSQQPSPMDHCFLGGLFMLQSIVDLRLHLINGMYLVFSHTIPNMKYLCRKVYAIFLERTSYEGIFNC